MRLKQDNTKPFRLAVIGAGFWAKLQVYAWQELASQGKIKLACIYNRTREKAENLKKLFGFEHVYNDAEEMFKEKKFDFVDIITSTLTHKKYVLMAARYKVPAIVQKPMAASLKEAREIVSAAEKAGIPFIVHENFRWQEPVRKIKELIKKGIIGEVKDITVQWRSGSFDYYKDQPYFKGQQRLFIGEVGVHLIDVARFLAGSSVKDVYTQVQHFNTEVKGEDFARILLVMNNQISANLEVSVETPLEIESPPNIFITVFGTKGTVELGPDLRLAVSKLKNMQKVTEVTYVPLHNYSWAGKYSLALIAMVPAHTHYLYSIIEKSEAETAGQDNINTLAATFGAYLSVEENSVVNVENLNKLERRLEEKKIGYPKHP